MAWWLNFQYGGRGFDSSSLPLDGFVFRGPEFKSYMFCKKLIGRLLLVGIFNYVIFI